MQNSYRTLTFTALSFLSFYPLYSGYRKIEVPNIKNPHTPRHWQTPLEDRTGDYTVCRAACQQFLMYAFKRPATPEETRRAMDLSWNCMVICRKNKGSVEVRPGTRFSIR